MSRPQPHAMCESPSPPASRPLCPSAIRPYLLAALAGALVTLLVQGLFVMGYNPLLPPEALAVPPQQAATATTTATPTATPTVTSTVAITRTRTPRPTRTRTPTPNPDIAAMRDDIAALREDVALLQTELRSLWSAYYLARAANQIADAEAALRVNDLDEVEQVLATVGLSLDLAYEQSDEQDKGPISDFRMQVGAIREDVYIRPEDMDLRLRRLRQSMLSLVDEDR